MYHISDVKKYLKCPTLFYHSLHEEKVEKVNFVRLDEALSVLAMEKLKCENVFVGQKNDEPEVAKKALGEYEWLVKARFEYQDLRVKVPFLHKTPSGYDLYFIFCGNYPKEDDLQFYVQTVWVLKNNNIFIDQCYILHFDANYVRGDELDPDQLFIVTDSFYNDSNHPTHNIKDAIYARMKNYTPVLEDMKNVENGECPEPVRTNKCTKRVKCPFYSKCFEEDEKVDDNSILTLVSSQHKYKMLQKGCITLKDADISMVEGSRQQYAQIMADMNNGTFVDKAALQNWINRVHYPIAFLDFEWDTYAIPPYKGMKPYDVLPFEYSIHILNEDGSIDHHEYVGTKDCRKKLIENMINDIGKKGSVVAYNAIGAEMIRIKEMIAQFPEYESPLMHIYYRMVDLQEPFMLGMVYDIRMKGLYSLKILMSMLDESAYGSLDIHQGMDAVYNWRQIDKDLTEHSDEIINHLKEYCGMDTYAMIKVYQWLQSLL